MKNVIIVASILAAATSNTSFAQCSKSPTPGWQPVHHRPAPPHNRHREELPQVASGQQITINGTHLGRAPGRIIIKVGQVILEGRVTGWSNSEVTVVMPTVPLSNSVTATIYVRTAQQQTADTLTVEFLPARRSYPLPSQQAELTTVGPGQAITLESDNLGSQPGQIRILIGSLTLAASVRNWSSSEVIAVLPNIPVTAATNATVQIVRSDGSIADQIHVRFSPAAAAVAVR